MQPYSLLDRVEETQAPMGRQDGREMLPTSALLPRFRKAETFFVTKPGWVAYLGKAGI